MKQENKEQIERKIVHLDRYRSNPLVEKVTLGETNFTRQVEYFYGINEERVYGATVFPQFPRTSYKNEESAKAGKYPKDLIEIADGFNNEPNLNSDLLGYEEVRRAHRLDKSARNKLFALNTGSYFSTFALAAACPSFMFSEKGQSLINSFGYNFEFSPQNLAISLIPALAAFVATSIGFLGNFNRNISANLKEYYKLERNAGSADSFMPAYRNYLLKGIFKMRK